MNSDYFKEMQQIANSPIAKNLEAMANSPMAKNLEAMANSSMAKAYQEKADSQAAENKKREDEVKREKAIKKKQLNKLRPNWNKWKYCEELSFSEAILLALNIDPSNYSADGGVEIGDLCFSFQESENIIKDFNDLLDLLYRAATNTPPKIQVVKLSHQGILKNYDFAKWWKSIGRTLPQEFPMEELGHDKKETPSETNCEYGNKLPELSANIKPKMPDWDKWKYLGECPLNDAVLLAYNICPDGHQFKEAFLGSICTAFANVHDKLSLLLDTAIRASKTVPPKLKCKNNGNVDLVEFGIWLKAIGRELPDGFPIKELITYESETPSDRDKPFAKKERDAMLMVIYGVAISKYGYDPNDTRNKATGEKTGSIVSDLQGIGLDINADTVRKYLQEANELYGVATNTQKS